MLHGSGLAWIARLCTGLDWTGLAWTTPDRTGLDWTGRDSAVLQATKLRPEWVKGHARRGAALMGLARPEEALEAYERAAALEPKNVQLR